MTRHRARAWIATAALGLGVAAGAAGVANAASGGSSTAASQGTTPPTFVAGGSQAPKGGPMGNPATMSHGPGETLLTGSAAAKAKAAALAAVPGATVIRVETDSGPAAYEAHLRRSDGSYVTVKLSSSFHVIATQSGFGSGGPVPPTGAGSGSA
jgi:hypothetical protein